MRAYLQQLRQELGLRLCEFTFPDPSQKPSKVSFYCNFYFTFINSQWWLCFARKRFLDKGLVSQRVTL